jgi:hypothetical protein
MIAIHNDTPKLEAKQARIDFRRRVWELFGCRVDVTRTFSRVQSHLNRDWRDRALGPGGGFQGIVTGGRWLGNGRFRVWPYEDWETVVRVPAVLVASSPWRAPTPVPLDGFAESMRVVIVDPDKLAQLMMTEPSGPLTITEPFQVLESQVASQQFQAHPCDGCIHSTWNSYDSAIQLHGYSCDRTGLLVSGRCDLYDGERK